MSITTSADHDSIGVYLGLQGLQCPEVVRHRGIPRYIRELGMRLVRDHRDLIKGLLLDGTLPVPDDLSQWCGHGLLRMLPGHGRLSLNDEDAAAIFHVLSPLEASPVRRILPPAFVRRGAVVVTLHDLIPLVFPDSYLPTRAIRAWYVARLELIKDADHVIAVSRTTRDDAIRLLGIDPERITVVYEGASDYFCPPLSPHELVLSRVAGRLTGLHGPYVLYAGGFEPRKRLDAAIEGFAHLPERLRKAFQLVVIGGGDESHGRSLLDLASRRGVADRLVLAGTVSDDLLRELYQACEVFIFPSVYEGFGLPVIEAMRCGAPVITSDRTSLTELVENEEARFDPEVPSDVARVVERVLTDADFRRRLRENGIQRSSEFTWERAAAGTAECYRALTAHDSQRRRHRAPPAYTIAFTLPPADTTPELVKWIQQFITTVCGRFALRAHLVSSDNGDAWSESGGGAIDVISNRQFQWLADRAHYDYIVHSAVAHPLRDAYESLRRHRGIFWLHDDSRLTAEIVGEISASADGIIVNSERAKEFVELLSPVRTSVISIGVATEPSRNAPSSVGAAAHERASQGLSFEVAADRFWTEVLCKR